MNLPSEWRAGWGIVLVATLGIAVAGIHFHVVGALAKPLEAILVQRVAGLDSRVLSFGSAGPFCTDRPIVRDVRFAGGANRLASRRSRLMSVARRTIACASS